MKFGTKASSDFNREHKHMGGTRNRAKVKSYFRRLAHKADRKAGKIIAINFEG